MIDILLYEGEGDEGDLHLTEDGDILVQNCLPQNIRIALLWIYEEWRLGPELGMPWFEEILVKNPNLQLIRQEILSTIREVDGVTEASVEILEYSPGKRSITFRLSVTAGGEDYSEEVTISG